MSSPSGAEKPWPKIDWRCQQCGTFWCTTEGHHPYGIGDPDCTNCLAGSTMNAEPFCHECGHALDWGYSLCEHFALFACTHEELFRLIPTGWMPHDRYICRECGRCTDDQAVWEAYAPTDNPRLRRRQTTQSDLGSSWPPMQ